MFLFFFFSCFFIFFFFFFFSSRRRHTRLTCDWSSDVCSSDLAAPGCSPGWRKGRIEFEIGPGLALAQALVGLGEMRLARAGGLEASPGDSRRIVFTPRVALYPTGAQIGRASCRERV